MTQMEPSCWCLHSKRAHAEGGVCTVVQFVDGREYVCACGLYEPLAAFRSDWRDSR